MCSPKIREDLVTHLYQKAKAQGVPMTRLIDRMLRSQLNGSLCNDELKFLLADREIKLDCGHQATIGHNFANTVIIVSNGGGKIKALCSEYGY